MDVEKRVALVESVGEEIITRDELRELLGKNKHPVAYDGFEPSGLAHLPFAIYRPINLEIMAKAGIKFKLYMADWFAWINNKMGGDLEKIHTVGEYFLEVWKAAGVDMGKIEVVWNSDLVQHPDYWKTVVRVAKNTSLARANRSLTIMGRKTGELKEVAQYFYPMMQTTDIFMLGADICQLGLDQRRANILAREIGPKLGFWKPVVVSHHMLMSLEGAKTPDGFDENKAFDTAISSKMSKSKPSSAIFVHDTREEIRKKIAAAYCPERIAESNPILDYSKHIIFRKFDTMIIERPEKFGGSLEIENYAELESIYTQGKLHPMDLKNTVADYLDKMIEPIRHHFEKNPKAVRLYNIVKAQETTR